MITLIALYGLALRDVRAAIAPDFLASASSDFNQAMLIALKSSDKDDEVNLLIHLSLS